MKKLILSMALFAFCLSSCENGMNNNKSKKQPDLDKQKEKQEERTNRRW